MPIHKVWKIKDNNIITDEQLNACHNDRVLAVLLKNRGIESPKEMEKFLNPLKAEMSKPDVFTDIDKAFLRIEKAVFNKEHITVYGDFDADGITAAALLYLTLKKIGADVDYYLPDRDTESHGLNSKALVKIISKSKSKLIITVDCGISNNAEVKFAKSFNTDIIITDHHEAPDILPEAYAIINPKAADSINPNLTVEEIQSLNNLAGVGVAFKLACKLLEEYKQEDYVNEILPLAAIGTIGDVVSLIGENRTIVSMGLELIKHGKHKGVQKLIASSGISDITNITAENIAFSIVPRLNAAGRLDSALNAIKVLVSDDDNEINEIVKLLNDLNNLRQELCDETFIQAKKMYENEKNTNKRSIILFNDNWHIGIIGIVCSKLVEIYNKPVFLMTRDSNNQDIIRCSSRSIKDVNIYDVLCNHKDLFEGFGGHKMAAGFSFNEKKISFNEFKKLLGKTIDDVTLDIDMSSMVIEADMVTEPCDITENTLENIMKLEPFGMGNPEPLFIMNDLVLKQFRRMGQNNNHIKIFASKGDSENIECIKWNCTNFNMSENSKFNILFHPKLNVYNNSVSVQYIINDLQSEMSVNNDVDFEVKILDHRNKKDIINQVIDFVNSTKRRTGIFIENPKLRKKLENSNAEKYIINSDTILHGIEQLMFFDCPATKDEFFYLIKNSNAHTVHLMNFDVAEINIDKFILTLSGMLKYAVSNLNGIFRLKKLSDALNVDEHTIDDSLNLLYEAEMIEYEQISDSEYKISNVVPVELSKIKQYDLYKTVEDDIKEINDFRKYYLDVTPEEIKEYI